MIVSSVSSLCAVRWAMLANSFASALAWAVAVSKVLSLRSRPAWNSRSRRSAFLSKRSKAAWNSRLCSTRHLYSSVACRARSAIMTPIAKTSTAAQSSTGFESTALACRPPERQSRRRTWRGGDGCHDRQCGRVCNSLEAPPFRLRTVLSGTPAALRESIRADFDRLRYQHRLFVRAQHFHRPLPNPARDLAATPRPKVSGLDLERYVERLVPVASAMHDHGRRGGLNARVEPECVRIRRVAVEVPINAGPLVPLALVLAAPNLQALADPGEWHRIRRVDRRSELPLLAGHIHLATSDIAAKDFQVIRTTILQPGKFESSVLIDPRQFVVRDNKVARRVTSFPDVTHRPH